jgi:arylsulfatase A-like enzyme
VGGRLVWEVIAAAGDWLGTPVRGAERKHAARVSEQFLDWLARWPGGRPFFAFLNYCDAHNPYVPPHGFDRQFGVRPETASDDHTLDQWFILDKKTLSLRQIRLVNDGYDDCLAYLDEQLGRLFDELDRRGVRRNTLVIVTADHGEHFGEHGLYGHASSLYDQEVRVLLLIVGPRRVPRGLTVGEAVTLRDIPATVADLLGFSPGSPFPGRTLSRHWSAGGPGPDSPADPLLSEVDRPVKSAPNQGRSPVLRGAMKSLAGGGIVYVRNGDGVEELYDVARDPRQEHDLSDSPEVRPLLNQFRDDLRRLLEAEPPRGPRR